MKPYPIEKLVYDQMFPRPKQGDPSSFYGLLTKSLIPEVRMETHAFYGHLDTAEAKYPGLDYSNKTHRIRLSRYPWHRRLFRAFDALGLTHAEIANLTKWEGTRWAKEKFEREQGTVIRDSTADDIPEWVEPEDRPAPVPQVRASKPAREGAGSGMGSPMRLRLNPELILSLVRSEGIVGHADGVNDEDKADEGEAEEGMDWMNGAPPDEEEEDDDAPFVESVGNQLNERLRRQAARRNEGLEPHAVMDEEWEQWFKQAMETGLESARDMTAASFLIENIARTGSALPIRFFPEEMVAHARDGRWEEVPEFVQDALRRTLEAEEGSDERLLLRQQRSRPEGLGVPS